MAARSGAAATASQPDALRRLAAAAGVVTPLTLAGERLLPVAASLDGLVDGLRRGSVVSVDGSMGLALQVAAGPSAAGSWVGVVGLPGLGGLAAAEAGLDLDRLAIVCTPPEGWADAVAALVDGIDVVLIGIPRRARAVDARRLAARARERGSLLVVVDGGSSGDRFGGLWPERVDLVLRVTGRAWDGLGDGHGHLSAGSLRVVASGRGVAGRERTAAVAWGDGR